VKEKKSRDEGKVEGERGEREESRDEGKVEGEKGEREESRDEIKLNPPDADFILLFVLRTAGFHTCVCAHTVPISSIPSSFSLRFQDDKTLAIT
jgi:hypothetical protein